ncbi:hypothetical protein ACFWYW_58905 [Nonomuraea sp. NPDC059023]|uniref:hypothetical protein n=1 Tax=unclassified Nonomuraea TaxID=2593643 RepID=UPI0036750822
MSDTLTAVKPYQLTIVYTDPATALWRVTTRLAWPDAKDAILSDASEANAPDGERVRVLHGCGDELRVTLDAADLTRLLSAADRAHVAVVADS